MLPSAARRHRTGAWARSVRRGAARPAATGPAATDDFRARRSPAAALRGQTDRHGPGRTAGHLVCPLIGIATYREQARWGTWHVPASSCRPPTSTPSPRPHTAVVRPERVESELAALEVALGGDLVQHVPDVENTGTHDPGPGTHQPREVRTGPGTALHRLLGPTAPVACHHHQPGGGHRPPTA